MRLGPIRQQTVRFDDAFAFTGHEHEGLYELVVGLTGIVGVRIGDDERYVRPDELLVVERGVFHVFWEAASPAAYWNAYFEGDVPLLDRLARQAEPASVASHAGGRFWRDASFARAADERVAHAVLGLVLDAAEPGTKASLVPGAAAAPIGFEARVRRQLTDLVRREPHRNHELTELARVFGVSKAHLATKVKRATGVTVMRLYYDAKIELALERLRAGESVKATAHALGFADPYHFSRKFKQLVGYPPSRLPVAGR